MIGAPTRNPLTRSLNVAGVITTSPALVPVKFFELLLLEEYTEPSTLLVPDRVTALIPAPVNQL